MPEIIWSTCLVFTKEETEFYRLRILKVASLVGDCLTLIIQNSHVLGGLVVSLCSLFWLFCFNCMASAKKKANCNGQTNYLYFFLFWIHIMVVTLCISLLYPPTVWATGPLVILSHLLSMCPLGYPQICIQSNHLTVHTGFSLPYLSLS